MGLLAFLLEHTGHDVVGWAEFLRAGRADSLGQLRSLLTRAGEYLRVVGWSVIPWVAVRTAVHMHEAVLDGVRLLPAFLLHGEDLGADLLPPFKKAAAEGAWF